MRYLNKLASVFCFAAMGLLAMTSCEGGELFDVNSPDWISEKIDSINATKGNDSTMPDGEEDVYTVGATDFSTGWWTQFSKYYVIPDGQVWNAVFNLNINPSAPNTYKNFVLIICNDDARDGATYTEYGAIRYDNQPSGNSEWGDYIDRSCVESNLTFNTDTDEGVQKLGGTVILTVDRSNPDAFTVKMTNGTVTKTYKQNTPLPNLNADAGNTNIRAYLVPEGSYINFLQSNIEPIGGFTSAEDKQPVSMELKSVPKKVMVGTSLEDAMANISATVTFETGITKEIPVAELGLVAVPDMNETGKKTLVAIYNKTFKNENCNTPITAQVQFDVVDKMFNILGLADNSTPFRSAQSEIVKVAPNETQVVKFTNYTDGAANWDNFVVVMVDHANVNEYGVVRADCFGWGNVWGASTVFGAPADMASWLADMDGAKVTLYVTNNGDGTVDITYDIIGASGTTYNMGYKGLTGVDPNDFAFKLSMEKAHLEFDEVVGNEDNTTGFLGAFSDLINVPAGKTVSTQFTNYTAGGDNYNNFIVDLCASDLTRYGVARADCWLMKPDITEWMGVEKSGYPADWATWLADMDGAKVNLSVTNNGDGTAKIDIYMIGANGGEYNFIYSNLTGINSDDLNFRITMEKSHQVFDLPFTVNKPASAKAGKVRAKARRR